MTLKDIAIQAGVSSMTVSRALRRDPKVSVELRARIGELADRLGYRPNPLVSALMASRRARTVDRRDLKLGFITAFATRDGWKSIRLYQEFFTGASMGAARHGYGLEEFWIAEPGMNAKRLTQVLLTRNIRGLFLAPLPGSRGQVDLDWEHFCGVAFGYSIAAPALHRVSNHQFRSMRLLLEQLSELGYRRPGLALARSLDERVLNQWLGGFLANSTNRDRHVPLFLIPDERWSRERFADWLERHRPDVVVAHQAEPLEWLRQMRRRVPEDIGFVHLDCPTPAGTMSGLYQNGPAIGIAAADLLVSLLHRNQTGVPSVPHTMVMEGTWCAGTTIRQVR